MAPPTRPWHDQFVKLYIFPISHFSEKARWACDYHGLDYELVKLVPGPHMLTMKRLGVRRTTVPVLEGTGQTPIQGSDRIIAHLDERHGGPGLTPRDAGWEELVKRADLDLGEGLRRIFYANMMTREGVIPLWSQDGAWWAKPVLHGVFPVLAKRVTQAYRLYPDDVAVAEQAFEALWVELEAQLGDRPYLYEDRLTRADITVASLLSPLVGPAQHPFPWSRHAHVDALLPFVARYRDRPLWRYVEALYARDRHTAR